MNSKANLKSIEDFIKEVQSDKYECSVNRIFELYNTGNYEEAHRVMDTLTVFRPWDVEPGVAVLNMRFRFPYAADYYRRAFKAWPGAKACFTNCRGRMVLMLKIEGWKTQAEFVQEREKLVRQLNEMCHGEVFFMCRKIVKRSVCLSHDPLAWYR